MAKTETQFNLRVPLELKEQIDKSAKQSGRSINAEAVLRLNESYLFDQRTSSENLKALEAILMRSAPSSRCSVIAERLNIILDEINAMPIFPKLQPARIAKAIGEEYAENVENWFAGKQEPSFKQLENIAAYLGVNSDWLLFGDGKKYQFGEHRVPESAVEGVTWLLDLDKAERPTHIYFIRQKSKRGELIIIKKYNDWRCTIHVTPYVVSEEVGSGGESSLAHLFVIWHLLYKIYVKTGPTIKSFILYPDDYKQLLGENNHPLYPLAHKYGEEWWEDIWDKNMIDTGNYWSGWIELCQRMHKVVEHKSSLAKINEQIASEEHPFIKEAINLFNSTQVLKP
ncbi:Arc family DNA-binding protein [uncultured Acinetobacter sp.]|uniref:Arc family DNA-binding protein n=1 Tax=uncultured Acinetobacter sp. TaxID=165433 RepID=UPI0025842870|nr:Arc family DNA-binding protein [uncultured Acinetobacter sp.]